MRLASDRHQATTTLDVALAPGLIAPVGVAAFRTIEMGETVGLPAGEGCLALDGEREIERRHGEEVAVRLVPGPLTIDVDAVMRHAADAGATRLQPSAE